MSRKIDLLRVLPKIPAFGHRPCQDVNAVSMHLATSSATIHAPSTPAGPIQAGLRVTLQAILNMVW